MTSSFQTTDCEGLQVCVCDHPIRPNRGEYACVDKKDRPSGECVSRREFLHRGVEDGERLADRICACGDASCVEKQKPQTEPPTPYQLTALSFGSAPDPERLKASGGGIFVEYQRFQKVSERLEECTNRWNEDSD
jgi:hypothetical protein